MRNEDGGEVPPAFEASDRQTGAVEKLMPLPIPTIILPAIMTGTLRAAIFIIAPKILALWPDRFRAKKPGSPVQTNSQPFWALTRDDIPTQWKLRKSFRNLQEAMFSHRVLFFLWSDSRSKCVLKMVWRKMWVLLNRRKRGCHVMANHSLVWTALHPTLASLPVYLHDVQ
jgi:hypothetical protein